MRPIADIVVMFTIGTGVGGGIVIGGRTFRGATGAAPEIGHTIIGAALAHGAPAAEPLPPPRVARAPRRRPRARPPRARARHRRRPRGRRRRPHRATADALDAMRILGEALGVGIANAINTFDPDLVIVGGGVSNGRRAAARARARVGRAVRRQGRRDAHGDPPRPLRPAGRAFAGATLLAGQELELGR